jgi:hypothetical protein
MLHPTGFRCAGRTCRPAKRGWEEAIEPND